MKLSTMTLSLLFFLLIALAISPSSASAAICPTGICGDGFVDPGEECDDGNLTVGDGCSADCTESFNMVVGTTLFTYPGEHPRDMAAADLNNDGITDLIVTNYRAAYLYTYLISPEGAITLAGRYALGSNTITVNVGNLNGDHFIDVVTADADTDQMHVFFGNGDGTLTLARIFRPGNRPWSVTVGDINTDGYADIIVANRYTHHFTVYLGDGTGNFVEGQSISTGGDTTGSDVSDINGDGYNDAAFVSCDETYGTPSLQVYTGDTVGLSLSFNYGMADSYLSAVKFIDLDRDGYKDIVTSGGPNLRAFSNQKDGTFTFTNVNNENQWGYRMDLGDLNNDGNLDVTVRSRYEYAMRVFEADGNGWFRAVHTYVMPYTQETATGLIIDLDGDGMPDVLTSVSNAGVVVPIINHNYYQFPACGDSRIGRGENCEDGNTANGDGCSEVCRIEESQDSDHDGLPDNDEWLVTSTDPLNPDSDGDCVFDGDEYCAGADPLDPSDQDGCVQIASPLGNWHMLVTLLGAPPSMDIDVYLTAPKVEPLIKHSLKNVGKVSQTPVKDGEIVTFSILVNGDYEYGSDSVFGRVTMIDAYSYRVGFEVLPLQSANWDYKDLTLLVEFVTRAPAVGIHTNSLDEFTASKATSAATDTDVALGFDGFAHLTIPADAVDPDAGAILTAGLPNYYQTVADPGKEMIGKFYKVNLTNGADGLINDKKASLTIAYEDSDNDGLVDGTALMADELAVYRFNNDTNSWEELPTETFPESKVVTAQTGNFSLFALGGKMPERLDDTSGSHSSANHGLFGCSVGEETGGPSGTFNLLLIFLAVLITAEACHLYGKKFGKPGSD